MSMSTYTTNAELDARKARRERIAAARATAAPTVFATGTLADLKVGDYVDSMGGKVDGVNYRRYRVGGRIETIDHKTEWTRRGSVDIVTFTYSEVDGAGTMPLTGAASYPVQYRTTEG